MPALNVSRTIRIASDPKTVFQTISDFSTWQRWSPWLLADPNADFSLHAEPSQEGGGFSWEGPVVGAGQMQHLSLQPPEGERGAGKIHSQLRFLKPWKSESTVDFAISPCKDPQGQDATEVRWEMHGSLPFFLFWMKAMMQSMISLDYDRGLRMAKELIETGNIASQTVVNGIQPVPGRRIFGVSAETTLSEIGPSMEISIGDAIKRLQTAGIATDGQWISIYHSMCMKTQAVSYTSGVVVAENAALPIGLDAASTTACSAMRVTHQGRYQHLGNAWFAAYQNLQAAKRKPATKLQAFEVYLNRPEDTPAESLVTEVYVPVN
ncbi:GyrI-like domain-containing protein [Stieleria sp. TO1_6]|uniref:GyrI-like domain-containing protein n=1 Tax=Stieleria tagensis TaxID=2956795 RepID=UPI00209ACEAD|nr:GyrI-like domain-containing protein [Stieleria tagensis]MCO8124286.1 GyrI-like domain-containing protein [Stieleria tagensis]